MPLDKVVECKMKYATIQKSTTKGDLYYLFQFVICMDTINVRYQGNRCLDSQLDSHYSVIVLSR